MKKVYKAVTSTIILAISPTVFATDIGIIPDTDCPAGSESITIYMDDEDNYNASKLTGWVGATTGNTKFKFCRVNGDQFKPLSNSEDYAVLKLSDSCPNNSIEFNRYFDNEDSRNNNGYTGEIYPNVVNHNTNLKFCYFKGAAYGMDSFPDIGVDYGVFAPKNFSKSLASGTIFTDDEDNNNANGLNVHGHSAIKAIIQRGGNTTLNVHKVTETANNNCGQMGSYTNISKKGSEHGNYTVYYPTGIENMAPTPLIFMVAGGSDMTASSYPTLINFMVSHGNTVLVSKGSFDPNDVIGRLEHAITELTELNISSYVNKNKIGVVGHSSGGGNAFNVLKHFSNKNYGNDGRFILSFDPFYIRYMTEADLAGLPSNTKAIIVQSSKDGKGSDNQTPKVALTIYSLLNSIPDMQKDYQVYLNDGHDYITGGSNIANMQHVLKPLDALMDYTFNNTVSAREAALEVGSDHPISDGSVTILRDNRYGAPCKHKYNDGTWLLNYCRDNGSLGL